jgi:hypothetical protein
MVMTNEYAMNCGIQGTGIPAARFPYLYTTVFEGVWGYVRRKNI